MIEITKLKGLTYRYDNESESKSEKSVTAESTTPYQQEYFYTNVFAEYTIARINIDGTHIKFTWPGGSTNNVPVKDLLDGTFDSSAKFEFSKDDKVIDEDDKYLIEESFPWMQAVARIAERQNKSITSEGDSQVNFIYQGLTGTFRFSYDKDGVHELVIPSLKFTGTYKELKAIDGVLTKLDPSGNLNRTLLCMEEKRLYDIKSAMRK